MVEAVRVKRAPPKAEFNDKLTILGIVNNSPGWFRLRLFFFFFWMVCHELSHY